MILSDSLSSQEAERLYYQATANENYNRLFVASIIVLIVELLTVFYSLYVLRAFIHLPFVIIPLCIVNIAVWLYNSKKHTINYRLKEYLINGNIALLLVVGAVWNIYMQGTPLAITIFMFPVFFVAAFIIIRPRYSLVLFLSTEALFCFSVLQYRTDGLAHVADIVNSIIFVVLAWSISVMLFRAHQKLYIDKVIIEEKNSQLEKLYVTDRLTGLFNRHKLDEELEKEINRADRYGHEVAVILIDVDKFKSFNDAFGHVAGDKALQDVSATMKSCLRITDTIGRWGGEEFMVICPDSCLKDAFVVAERIRLRVSETEVALSRPVTLSLGVSSYRKGEGKESFIRRVDRLLYAAKDYGGNKVFEKQAL